MNFESLDLNDDILDALYDMRFEKCTPIQENCIPEILKGKDVLGVAQTGTGKTAAYLLPVLSKLADGGYPEDAINCLIMSPTRELAQQIDQAIQGFSYYLNGVSCVAVYGGNDGNRYDQELKSLSLGANLVIATPGRFISHMSLGNVDLSKVSFFILDEADRMLDMGFSEDIMTIQKNLPKTCQTIMFSATMPKKIEDLAQTLLTNPSVIKLAVSKPAEKIHQLAYVCHETQKMGIIKDIFKAGNLQRVIIFSGSKQKVKQIALSLNQKKINCGQMHSDLAQAERDEMMFKFKSGQIDVLVATDILARGIDIDDIAMVINYDVPHDAEDYVHRIGRTARADRKGSAITFVNEDDIYYFQQIENFLEKEVEKAELPEGLGEGLDYVSRNKERRKTSAKSRRRKDRDQQSHKDKKVRNNRRNNNQPTATNETKKQDVKTKKVQDGKNEPAKSYKKNNNRKQRPTNFNGEVVETTDKQTPKKRQNRVQKDNKDSKTDKKQPQTVAETTNNKPKKKRPKKKKQPSFEANDTQRSSKYDMSEYFPKPKKEESRLKKLIKKPLKWLSNLGKK
ncbi:cold-shock DEAD-box protein A family protein [Prevotella disiens JCM 6334 = ATCC 29426]|uniref:Cold-shock DEAD box protein A n=2 Tax=Prevotella disiens TaxID=28130 RepID=A0A379DZ54_9BACT|nr:DEAD/DEAH box helicase [Prevotella disiens]ERJ78713.1 cold-shock DEAD-box protein A family protein [Prevotella disiens JCM 6334 = ATCC 29426]SUB85354.1 Cold-shock DEAD box protein A [Prevotella disiens]